MTVKAYRGSWFPFSTLWKLVAMYVARLTVATTAIGGYSIALGTQLAMYTSYLL